MLFRSAGKSVSRTAALSAQVSPVSHYPIAKVNFFVNNLFVGSATKAPWQLAISLSEVDSLAQTNELKAVAYDVVGNKGEAIFIFTITE